MATQQEIIKKFMYALDTTTSLSTSAVNQAIDYATNGTFKTMAEAAEKMLEEQAKAKNSDDFLENYCGIIIDNEDTGAISGSDAGGSQVKTAQSIVPEKNSATVFDEDEFTVSGLTVKLEKTYNDLSDYEKYVWNNLHEHWIKSSLDLIAETYGDNFSFNSNSTVHEITITFSEKLGADPFLTSPTFSDGDIFRETTIGLSLDINLAYYKFESVDYSDLNGKPNGMGIFYGVDYLDRNIAHEFTHSIMQANIKYCNFLPRMILEGMAELTHGIDDTRTDDLKALAADSDKLKEALTDAETVTGINQPRYAGGYMFLRWFAKYASENASESVGVSLNNSVPNIFIGGTGNDTIRNYASKVTINGGEGDDSINNNSGGSETSISGGDGKDVIDNYASDVTILGGAESDKIYNWIGGKKVFVSGGAGNDSIYNYGDSVTIDGGTGDDYIWLNANQSANVLINYSSGNDLIQGFRADSTLSILGGNFSSTKSGSDIILTVGTGKITLSGAATLSTINIVDTSQTEKNVPTEGNDYLENFTDKATINALGGNDTVYNSGNNSSIIGGADNDSIKNYGSNVTIYGDLGNDDLSNLSSKVTIIGGAGKDSLWNEPNQNRNDADYVSIDGGAGDDSINNFGNYTTILGGAGNDSIYNYSTGYRGGVLAFDSVGRNVKINGGTGDDYIFNNAANALFQYFSGDGNDKISGFNETSTLSIGGGNYSSTKSGSDIIFTVGTGKITLEGAASLSKINIVGNSTSSTTSSGATIKGSSQNDIIKGGAGNDSITGEAGADSIFGGAGDDKLLGNNGKDSLWGGAGNDTLTGGNGKDFFIYSEGNDVITDYAVTERISLGANISDTALNGLDVILTTDAGTLTIKKAKGKTLNLINPAGKSFSTMVGVLTNLTVTNLTKSPVTVGSAIKTVTAASRTKAAKISGNALDNTMTGGKGNDTLLGGAGDDSIFGNTGNDTIRGGVGNDTLLGGKGNDLLWGNAGADVFIYESGDGQDVIFGFEDDDMLQITGNFSSTYESSKREIYFAVDSTSNALTLKNFTATTFNINGTNYKISGADLIRN